MGSFCRTLKKIARVQNYLWGHPPRARPSSTELLYFSFTLGTLYRKYVLPARENERSYRLHTVARMQSNRTRSSECTVTRHDSYSIKILPDQKDHPERALSEKKGSNAVRETHSANSLKRVHRRRQFRGLSLLRQRRSE